MGVATWADPTVAWADPFITWDGAQIVLFNDLDVLSGSRVTAYRFDLLDQDENLLGYLQNVLPGGEVSFDSYSSIKGSGRISVTDLGDDEIDWLNVRIRPTVLISRVGGASTVIEVPVGVYLCSAPTEKWTATGRAWDIELHDKLSILDQDIATGVVNGVAAYTAAAGANIITLVKTLIGETGEAYPAILPDTSTLPNSLVWEVGTTRLKIINDLLDAGNYFSLWCDGQGQYQATPYVDPSNRPVLYESIHPFSSGPDSLMDPAWQRDRDIYSVPNRYVCIGQGSGTDEALVSEATNTNPLSPYSYARRGRWITTVETGVEAATQAALDAIAARRLAAATSVTTSITVQHAFLPDMLINTVVRFTNPSALLNIICTVRTTTIPFSPTALCSSKLVVIET